MKIKNFFAAACIGAAMFLSACTGSQKAPSGDITVIVAHVSVKPEYKDEMLKVFQDVVTGTHTEAGNIDYTLYQDQEDPLKFTFIEYWKSPEAIASHNSSAHFQTFAKAVQGKADLEVHTLKKKY
jgi:quinol monooxygenase YgiN